MEKRKSVFDLDDHNSWKNAKKVAIVQHLSYDA